MLDSTLVVRGFSLKIQFGTDSGKASPRQMTSHSGRSEGNSYHAKKKDAVITSVATTVYNSITRIIIALDDRSESRFISYISY